MIKTFASAKTTWIDTTIGRILVHDTEGDGPPVLLVHSLLAAGEAYAPLVPLLVERGFRCIIPELPFGVHSVEMKPNADITPATLAVTLVEVLDALHIPQTHIVGVDTGGALTQMMMAYHRERIDHVILTACDAYDAFPPRGVGLFVKFLKIPGMLRLYSRLMKIRFLRPLTVGPRPLTHAGLDRETLRRWTQPLLIPGIRRDLHKILVSMHPRYTLAAAEANRNFPRPVLVAWGDDDLFFPRRLGIRLAADLPHAQLVTLPDCAALAALDQPKLLALIIDEHIHDRPIQTKNGVVIG